MSQSTVVKDGESIEKDDSIVDWDGPNDPDMPLNWTTKKRYTHAAIVSIIALLVNLPSTMYAPAAPLLMKDLSIDSSIVGSLTVSIYVLGWAVGPLLLAPLSELYGRLIVYHATNLIFLAFILGCALSTNEAMFLAFRFMTGCASSAPMTIGGGTVADLFPQEKRGSVMGMIALGPRIGPVIGPIAGGFIAQNLGWQWTFWIILVVSGVVDVAAVIFMRETYAPVLLARKTTRLQKETNNLALRSKLDKGIPLRRLVTQAMVRPFKLLLLSPIALLLNLYSAFAFGLTFLLFTTIPGVFSGKYHFTTGTAGLAYLGVGIGFFFGVIIFGRLSDRLLKGNPTKHAKSAPATTVHDASVEKKSEEDKTAMNFKPENRLILMCYLSPVLPIGFFWYGWSAQAGVHWIVPILGTSLIGVGSLFIMVPIMTYLIDTFGPQGAASALAANALLRSLFGAFLPLAGPAMYDSLGLGWGNSLLGFIGLAFIPLPFLFFKYGETIRTKWPVRL